MQTAEQSEPLNINSSRAANVTNFLLFYAAWPACVVGAAKGVPWLGLLVTLVLLSLHKIYIWQHTSEFKFVLVAAVIGTLGDALPIATGLVSFPSPANEWALGIWPVWYVCLWLTFPTTLRFSLRWLLNKPTWAAIFGGIGGPLTFFIAARIGAIELGQQPALSLSTVGLLWALYMFVFAEIHKRWKNG